VEHSRNERRSRDVEHSRNERRSRDGEHSRNEHRSRDVEHSRNERRSRDVERVRIQQELQEYESAKDRHEWHLARMEMNFAEVQGFEDRHIITLIGWEFPTATEAERRAHYDVVVSDDATVLDQHRENLDRYLRYVRIRKQLDSFRTDLNRTLATCGRGIDACKARIHECNARIDECKARIGRQG
jgi:hypothetical protein